MDARTLTAYDAASADCARDRAAQAEPSDRYGRLREHCKTGPTLDIGCGSGRDINRAVTV